MSYYFSMTIHQENFPGQESSHAFIEPTLDGETLPGISEGEIIVIRSTRRKKNISAYRQGGRIVVSIPARMSKADERAMVPEMVAKIRAQEAAATMSEERLSSRVDELLTELAPEISLRPSSINWRGMRERWGSCTSTDRTIRISDRLKGRPTMFWIMSSSMRRSTSNSLTMALSSRRSCPDSPLKRRLRRI
jgi:predicted metal-dependent hydrolase